MHVQDGEMGEVGSRSVWFEHGAVRVRMQLIFITLDNALSWGEHRGT